MDRSIVLKITEEERKLAQKMGNATHQATGIIASTRIFTPTAGEQDLIGQMGQIKFHNWLVENHIPHEYHTYNSNGYGDEFDIKIKNKKIDVDTGQNRYHIPDEKLHFVYFVEKNFEKFDYVVSVLLDNDLVKAKLMGYLTKEEMRKLPIRLFGKTDARYCEWYELHPIIELPELGFTIRKIYKQVSLFPCS
jgi:hypothetical protein